jgi:integrase
MKNFKIKKIPHPKYGNQILPMLVDTRRNFLPEPSAALWGWQLWFSNPFNTVFARLQDLCVFYEYIDRYYPDFFKDAANLRMMKKRQLNDLSSFLLLNFHYDITDAVKVNPSTFNRRIDSVKLFLDHHYSRYIERIDDINRSDMMMNQLNTLCKHLAKKRYSSADIQNHTKQATPLSNEQIDIIRTIIRPSDDIFVNKINPFRAHLQLRNACLILLLCELGCRASELVLIRNNDKDVKLTTNATVVIQTQDQKDTSHRGRRDGASHKTFGRELPISPGLADLLMDYIEESRPKLRKAFKGQFTQYLFVSDKDGGPLTTDGLDYVINSLYRKVPELKQVIHPHQFRVTRGGELRDAVDKKYEESNSPMIKSGDMQDTLTTWGGWSSTSTMPKHYTIANIQAKLRQYLAEKVKT